VEVAECPIDEFIALSNPHAALLAYSR
jgi:hypothetical protein